MADRHSGPTVQLDVSSFANAIAEIIQARVSLGLNDQTKRGLEALTQEVARLSPSLDALKHDVERLEAAVKAQQSVIEPFFQSVNAMLRYHPDVRQRDEALQAFGDPFLTEFREALPVYILGRVGLDDIYTPILARAQAAKEEADRAALRATIDRATAPVTGKGMLRKKYLFDDQEFATEAEANAARSSQVDLEMERTWLARQEPVSTEPADALPEPTASTGAGDQPGEVNDPQQAQAQYDPVDNERTEPSPAEPPHQNSDRDPSGEERKGPGDQRA